MKIITFNVNGLRARLHQLKALIEKHSPDVIGLQEIKVTDDDFPVAAIEELGYHVEYFGQKTHYGVALMSKTRPLSVQKGFLTDEEDAQRRMIVAEYQSESGQNYSVLNGYFPQGENQSHETKYPAKRKYYSDLQDHLDKQCDSGKPVIVMGDFNISHTDADIGIGPDNAKRWLKTGKCSFLPEERQWFDTLLGWGLNDCYRQHSPANSDELYSWFDYRSRGFEREPRRGLRIDGILATDCLMKQCRATGIDYEIRGMEKPSDHAPLWVEFDF